jgi:hypothetical protein
MMRFKMSSWNKLKERGLLPTGPCILPRYWTMLAWR